MTQFNVYKKYKALKHMNMDKRVIEVGRELFITEKKHSFTVTYEISVDSGYGVLGNMTKKEFDQAISEGLIEEVKN